MLLDLKEINKYGVSLTEFEGQEEWGGVFYFWVRRRRTGVVFFLLDSKEKTMCGDCFRFEREKEKSVVFIYILGLGFHKFLSV